MKSLSVELPSIRGKHYPIYIEQGLFERHDLWQQMMQSFDSGQQVAVVTNPLIAKLYLPKLQAALSDYEIFPIIIKEGEAEKNLTTMASIYDTLSEAGFNRNCTLIALGGGVIGDMTGFVAATWMRGVNYIQVPTTLLSQVDSSVGGKTGVNIAGGKNMVGAFYHPQAVMIDLSTLVSLPNREFRAGLAEVIKYGLIADADFFLWLKSNLHSLLSLDTEVLTYTVERSVTIKADVVAKDEKEHGLRAILNLGHTFGHAIEAMMGYGEWLHGEAIAAGMVYATKLSHELGWIEKNHVQEVIDIFQQADLPIKGPENKGFEDYWSLMCKDKKSRDKGLPLVLLNAIGEATVSYNYERSQVKKILQ